MVFPGLNAECIHARHRQVSHRSGSHYGHSRVPWPCHVVPRGLQRIYNSTSSRLAELEARLPVAQGQSCDDATFAHPTAEERALDLKEKELLPVTAMKQLCQHGEQAQSHQEREAALEKERLMAVKYKDRPTTKWRNTHSHAFTSRATSIVHHEIS